MIFTGYYAKLKNYKENELDPIAISGKRPDFYEGLYYSDFAPRYEMFQRWKKGEIDNAGYVKEYKAYLDTLNKEEIKKDFEEYYKSMIKNCVLLCYEKSADFCHRHVLAEWLKEEFGWEICEFYG